MRKLKVFKKKRNKGITKIEVVKRKLKIVTTKIKTFKKKLNKGMTKIKTVKKN